MRSTGKHQSYKQYFEENESESERIQESSSEPVAKKRVGRPPAKETVQTRAGRPSTRGRKVSSSESEEYGSEEEIEDSAN